MAGFAGTYKSSKKARVYYEKSCPYCGYRNRNNLGQKKTKCCVCFRIY